MVLNAEWGHNYMKLNIIVGTIFEGIYDDEDYSNLLLGIVIIMMRVFFQNELLTKVDTNSSRISPVIYGDVLWWKVDVHHFFWCLRPITRRHIFKTEVVINMQGRLSTFTSYYEDILYYDSWILYDRKKNMTVDLI